MNNIILIFSCIVFRSLKVWSLKFCWLTVILLLIQAKLHGQCPAPYYSSSSSGCTSGNVQMNVTSNVDASVTDVSHKWYTAQSGGSAFLTTTATSPTSEIWTSQYTFALYSATTYWVSTVCNGTESSTRKSVFWEPTEGNISISTGGVQPYICIGNSITLTPQGGYSYSWSSTPSDANATGSGSITVSPSVNTTYTLSGFESTCDTHKTTSLTIRVDPKVGQVSVSTSSTAFCGAPTSSIFTASATDASSYSWTINPSSAASSTSTNTFTASNGLLTSELTVNWNTSFVGTFTATATAYSGSNCNYTTQAAESVEIYAIPTSPSVSNVSTTCGVSANLTATGALESETYRWYTVASGGTPTQATTYAVGPFSPGTYYYYVSKYNTLSGCESGRATTTVTANNLAGASTNTPISALYNSSVTLTATGANSQNGETYKWYSGDHAHFCTSPMGGSCSTGTLNTNTSYTFYVTKINNSVPDCETPYSEKASLNINLYVDPPPAPSVSNNTCGSKTLTLPTPPPGVTYYWQGSDPAEQSTYTPIDGSYTFDLNGPFYINAKANNIWLWSNVVTIPASTSTVDPVDLVVTSFDPANTIVQATHSITLSADAGGFVIPAGSAFTAKIAITPECNDYFNWTENIVYDENAIAIADSRTYFDGSGRTLLTESKDILSNKIFASQPIYDLYHTPSASTLAAPILEHDFIFKRNFVRNTDNAPYSPNDFDLNSPGNAGDINNPRPVGEQPGTVGWYYSANNNLEPLTPVTDYPYARSYTPEGPNPTTTKIAGVGDAHRMGAGHEAVTERQRIGANDLNHYVSVRSYFVATSLPVTGYKYIATDPDGKKAVSFVDADGRSIASATLSGTTFDNWSYSFYNDLGQLIATVAPNGVNTVTTAKPEFVTTYKYDHLGRLIETTSPDEGTSKFVYSTDGKIRFSQNAVQAAAGKFSYTNYDYLGRLIESGEYMSGNFIFEPHSITTAPATNSILNIIDQVGQSAGISRKIISEQDYCNDYTFIEYDLENLNGLVNPPASFQTNLNGQVSRTENENAITLYSYDEFGQVIKSWQLIKVAEPDVVKTVDYTYDYLGNVTEVAYQKDNTADRFYHHYAYDLNQRLIEVNTSKDGTTKKLQARYEYYLHGPLKRVVLADNLQGIDYTYAIDGSLKTINNADPAKDPGSDGTDIFGQTLHYFDGDYTGADYQAGTQAITGYNNQFSGLLKATSWHSPVDKNQKRTYAYQYDSRNQLTDAVWGTMTGTEGLYGFVPANLEAHREAVPSYDKNGNISSLLRKGKDGNTLANYGYDYEAHTNKLDKVNQDGLVFVDYTYNSIGQMIQQVEGTTKNFAIFYNAYGLVKEIRNKNDADKLVQSYSYDDRGNLLQKIQYAEGVAQLYTTYISDVSGNTLAIYQQTGSLMLAEQPAEVPVYGAGRLALHKPQINTYFYEVTDHLGNVRGVIGMADTETFPATMESEMDEEPPFENITPRRVSKTPPGTASGNEMVRMNSEYPEGPGIVLKVSPGDVVTLEADAYYEAGVLRDYFATSSSLITAIATVFGGVSGAAGEAGRIYDGIEGGFGNLFPGSGGGSAPDPEDDDNPPYAFLTYMVFDVNMLFQYGGYQAVSAAGNMAIERLAALPAVNIEQPGFVYIFLYNRSESINWVYFDNLSVTHEHSPIVAGGDYYPFGLPTEGREITDEPYRYGYQGQYSEKDKTTGWNEFELRFYDARIARWMTADPFGQHSSPYVAMGNVPHVRVDPTGGYAFNFGRGLAYGGIAATVGGILDLASGGDGTRGALIGLGTGFIAGGGNWSSLKMPNLEFPQGTGNLLASAGRNIIQQTVEEKAVLFKNETKAYNYIWDNSFKDIPYGFRVPWRENFGWITDKGVLVLPTEGWEVDSEGNRTSYYTNSRDRASAAFLPVKDGYVIYNNMKLKILGAIHSHPADFDGRSPLMDGDLYYTRFGPVFAINHKEVLVAFKMKGENYMQPFTTKNNLLKGGWSIYQNLSLFPK